MKEWGGNVGDSLRKNGEEEKKEKENICGQHTTPKKSRSGSPDNHEESFLVKTSNRICSSVKKILSTNLQSIKKIVPKFMRSEAKVRNLAI